MTDIIQRPQHRPPALPRPMELAGYAVLLAEMKKGTYLIPDASNLRKLACCYAILVMQINRNQEKNQRRKFNISSYPVPLSLDVRGRLCRHLSSFSLVRGRCHRQQTIPSGTVNSECRGDSTSDPHHRTGPDQNSSLLRLSYTGE